jgi:Calcineurin-like phosphoesterase
VKVFPLSWFLSIALAAGLACSATGQIIGENSDDLAALPKRDWASAPAIVQIDDADVVYAVSDVHGHYAEFGHLLEVNGLVSGFSPDPEQASAAQWTAGRAILVVAGDLIDKGPNSLAVIDLLRSLQDQAPAKGGRVVVTLGNHEAEFLADPKNKKAGGTGLDKTGIGSELSRRGIKPAALARGKDAEGRGTWLLNLPFAVRVKNWFFAHGGNTAGDSLAGLQSRLARGLDKKGYDSKELTGGQSMLEAQEWYGDPNGDTGKDYARALGVRHIAFGHDPGAFGERGQMRASKGAWLVKLDVAMGRAVSGVNAGGQLLRVETQGPDRITVLDASGSAAPLPLAQ